MKPLVAGIKLPIIISSKESSQADILAEDGIPTKTDGKRDVGSNATFALWKIRARRLEEAE